MTCQKNDDDGKKQLWTRCRKQTKSNAKNVLNSEKRLEKLIKTRTNNYVNEKVVM